MSSPDDRRDRPSPLRWTSSLAPLADLPVAEHPAAYDAVHRLLQDALGRLDEG